MSAGKPDGGWGRADFMPADATVTFWPAAVWEWYLACGAAVEALGIAPGTLEADVKALVLSLRESPDMAGCCADCDAKMNRRQLALAPFAHLEGGPLANGGESATGVASQEANRAER